MVETNRPDEARDFADADPLTDKIGQNADFLAADMKRGIIPSTFLPLQSGVGNIANSSRRIGTRQDHPRFRDVHGGYSEPVIRLIAKGQEIRKH